MDIHSYHFYSTLCQKSIQGNQTRKRNKRQPKGKVRSKTILVTDGMILYIENPKNSTKVLLKLREKFKKFARYNINIQKLIAFLNTCNEQSQRELSKPFYSITKKNKIQRIIL